MNEKEWKGVNSGMRKLRREVRLKTRVPWYGEEQEEYRRTKRVIKRKLRNVRMRTKGE